MKKKFLNNKEKQALKQKRADMIVESFNDTYNKIKRLNDSDEVKLKNFKDYLKSLNNGSFEKFENNLMK
jgi:hypothetical protein